MSKYLYPCKECTKRYVGCHSECEGYIEAKKAHDDKAQMIREAKRPELVETMYRKDKSIKNHRKNKRYA